jgi:hypothetical protein
MQLSGQLHTPDPLPLEKGLQYFTSSSSSSCDELGPLGFPTSELFEDSKCYRKSVGILGVGISPS